MPSNGPSDVATPAAPSAVTPPPSGAAPVAPSAVTPPLPGAAPLVHCVTCGYRIAANAPTCPQCGAPNPLAAPTSSTRTKGVAALLCILGFVLVAGMHRFYVGKIGTGVLMLVTLGALGVWTLIDFILILVGEFNDRDGLPLKP